MENEKDGIWNEIRSNYWEPLEVGDTIEGVVIMLDNDMRYGLQLTIKTKNNEDIKTPFHKILQERLKNVKIGELIRIVYKGTLPTNRGKDANLYKVFRWV